VIAEIPHPLLWLPQAAAATAAALAWVTAAVLVSRGRVTALQVCSVLLGCAHAAAACRSFLIGLGYATTDAYTAVVGFLISAACLSVACCVAYAARHSHLNPAVCPIAVEASARPARPVVMEAVRETAA
jgi:hypothetical protein